LARRVKSLRRLIGRDERRIPNFSFPVMAQLLATGELVNSLLHRCHYHDAKAELALTSFLRQRYRDYRLSSIRRICYIAVKRSGSMLVLRFAPTSATNSQRLIRATVDRRGGITAASCISHLLGCCSRETSSRDYAVT